MPSHRIFRHAKAIVKTLYAAAVAATLALHTASFGAAPGAASCSPPTTGSPCDGSGVGSGPTGSSVNTGAGNPINVITGNKYQREVDMPALPGELGLEIVRHYNSAISVFGLNGIIGHGWKLSYQTELYDFNGAVQILPAEGGRLMFNRDKRNPSLCSTADPANGTVVIVPNLRGDEYVWTWANGRKLYFNHQGKLGRIVAPSGASVHLEHDAQGRLVKVTDPQWRSMDLIYLDKDAARAGDRFKGVQTIDSPVGRFTYEYGSALPKGSTVASRIGLANLVRVRLPTSYDPNLKPHAWTSPGTTVSTDSRVYHYENPQFPALLTGISIESGTPAALRRYATFGYDRNGHANLSTHAGDVGKVTLDAREAGKTVLTNSLGQQSVYRHTVIAGAHRLLEVRGPGCASCGQNDVRYDYDSLGRLTARSRLTAAGESIDTTKTELDGQGRTRRISKVVYRSGKPMPAQWLARFEYEGARTQPRVIARPSVVAGKEALVRIAYNDHEQPLSVLETGWSPASDGKGAPIMIERTTAYRYATINNRSVLMQIDGPLPNGKSNSTADSDITEFEYDHRSDDPAKAKPAAKHGELEMYSEEMHKRHGILTAIIAPGNFKSTLAYDEVGRIVAVTAAAGRATSLRYAPRGQLLSMTTGGITHRIAYDALDNVVESAHSDGKRDIALVRFGYDDAGRNTWTASSLGILATRAYDTESRLVDAATQSSTIRQAQHYAYDRRGQLLSATGADGGVTRFAWNALNLPEVVADALGRETRYGYDAAGNVTEVLEAANTAQARLPGSAARFELDEYGRLQAVVAPGGAATRYVKDDFGRTLVVQAADGGKTINSFDAADRLVASTDANGNRAVYEYDVAGHIVRQSVTDVKTAVPDGKGPQTVTQWRYEGARLVAIDHAEQTERYTHDAQGRVSTKTVTLKLAGGAQRAYVTRYRYDALGQLAGVGLPDGSSVDYVRNGQNQVTAVERNPVQTSWLRWLMPGRSIVKNLERDVVGLKRFTYGNGIEAIYQRSREGALARIVHRDPRLPAPGGQGVAALEILLGIGVAHAAPADGKAAPSAAPSAAPAAKAALQPALPGALGLPPDLAALLDHRYLWDVKGNLLYERGKDAVNDYVYDARDRLIAAGSASLAARGGASFSRYHYDGAGNRMLAQEGIADQADTQTNTFKTAFAHASNRWQVAAGGGGAVEARYNATGQPVGIGGREYVWDALGKLLEVREGKRTLASYRYNHRGERIAKNTGEARTHYLYENRKLVAELDGKGRVVRQYVYLADQPIAVIDTPEGSAAASEERGALASFATDIAAICKAWFSNGETIAYLHNNHLGATELVTDAKGKPIWQAAYGPFGTLRQTGAQEKVATGAAQFRLNLRFPGQYADEETGLYYNDHRYYDPGQGRYLTPDPLGLRAGANGYLYASGNPLKNVDPSGLILFAFDGTSNGENPPATDSISNVLKFYAAYDEAANGKRYYITGIGTTNPDMPYRGSVLTGDGFEQRVALGFTFLDSFMRADIGTDTVDVDVVGFSRGAAEGRVWLNLLATRLVDGAYTVDGKTRCINLRFEGLWDTVPHIGANHGEEVKYDFSIPPAVKYAAHAVALNEHRGALDDFDMRSIMDSPGQASSSTRIEKGFIGSHSDIGGGFGTGDLSDVALMWMIDQATRQGIAIKSQTIRDNGWNVVNNPIVHDKSNNRTNVGEVDLTRNIVYGNGRSILQTDAVIDGKRTSDTRTQIDYFPNPFRCGTDLNPDVGLVDMTEYDRWLASYGVPVTHGPISNSSCRG